MVIHRTVGIGGGKPWATLAVPVRELQPPPSPPSASSAPAPAMQKAPSYMRLVVGGGTAAERHPSLPGPLRDVALGAHATARQRGTAPGVGAGMRSGSRESVDEAVLIAPERAHLDRIARLEARMARKARPRSAASAAAAAVAAAVSAEAAAAAAAAYSQDLVRSQVLLLGFRVFWPAFPVFVSVQPATGQF